MAKRKVKVIWRKLGRERAWGQAHHDPANPLIEIDTRLSPFRELEVLCHEICHLEFPELSESRIDAMGKAIAKIIWAQNYRRVVQSKHTTPVKIT